MSHTITEVSSEPVIKKLVFFGTIIHVTAPLCPAKRNFQFKCKLVHNLDNLNYIINIVKAHFLTLTQEIA